MDKKNKLVQIPFIVAAVDQAIKFAIRRVSERTTLMLLPGVVRIVRRTNTGMAFSLFAGHPALIALFSAALILGILAYAFFRLRLTNAAKYALLILTGGAMGNLVDRVALGGVTDYIQVLFVDFPVFNFADICITLSVGVLMFLLLTGRMEEGEQANGGAN